MEDLKEQFKGLFHEQFKNLTDGQKKIISAINEMKDQIKALNETTSKQQIEITAMKNNNFFNKAKN